MSKTDDNNVEIFKKACQNFRSINEARAIEDQPGFVGWVVCSRRPMCLSKPISHTEDKHDREETLWLGTHGTIFDFYEDAAWALVKTYKYCQEMKYTWFDEGKTHTIQPLLRQL